MARLMGRQILDNCLHESVLVTGSMDTDDIFL